jgi:hypothetical protein
MFFCLTVASNAGQMGVSLAGAPPPNYPGTVGDASFSWSSKHEKWNAEQDRPGDSGLSNRALECNVDELAKQLDKTVGYVATRLSLLSRNGHIIPIWPRVVYRVTSAGIEAFGEDGP